MNTLYRYKAKLEKAELKIRILEDFTENITRDLYDVNKSLESFAYISSHDMQEPLRTITNFVELLQEQYKGKLDENADIYIHYIIESADRMRALIKDLLYFSRIGHDQEIKKVDCRKLIEGIIADFYYLVDETKARITYRNLPIVNGSESELRLLFQNLLHNAIKFSKKNSIPQIVISAIKKNAKWEFSIEDNGIGIDIKNQDKIFMIFKRLNNRQEYQGTGIGLAYCKKVIDLYGEKIWVESELNKGSTFYFNLPN